MTKRVSPVKLAAVQPERTRVLIVDDVPQNRLLLGIVCDQLGFQHEPAENGYEAVEAARSGRFDIVLMDILMPRMDGMSATRAIRALPGRASQVPIVAVTTAAAPGEVLRYLSCGMNDVVPKPVERTRLAEAMRGALEAAREPALETGERSAA
ncbi:MAG TPA: response regulator [Caulobacteraceae bacterium]|jgi:CheY-like chemotaxis protein